MVTRIQVGTEVVTSDDSIASPLNLEHSQRGNLVSLPLRDRVLGDANSFGERRLRTEVVDEPLKRGLGTVTHMSAFLHSRLNSVNPRFIAGLQPSADNKRMVDTPKPEHYPSFATWLEATRKAFRVQKQQIADIAGVSPQAVTKWFKGGDVRAEPLQKIADWSGVPYASLRLLLEGKPLADQRTKKGAPAPSPAVQRIARKVQSLQGDEASLSAVEVLVDTFLSQSAQKRKTGA